MDTELLILLAIIWTHTVGDFWLQSNIMFSNEKDTKFHVIKHSTLYAVALSCLTIINLPISWIIVNIILHIAGDLFSYKIMHKMFLNKGKRAESLIFGIDQIFHLTCLLVSYKLLK